MKNCVNVSKSNFYNNIKRKRKGLDYLRKRGLQIKKKNESSQK